MLTYGEQFSSFLAGATAGIIVDCVLYPIDTIKTRLQSGQWSRSQSKFTSPLAGIKALFFGSAPSAAVFFASYELVKNVSSQNNIPLYISSPIAASSGEIAACLFRVPMEVVKQRAQNNPKLNVSTEFKKILKIEGVWGLYRGYLSTIFRELPFSCIQFPLWEFFKRYAIDYNKAKYQSTDLSNIQYSICGGLAGAVSGAVTTPLDVAKTQIILANKEHDLAKGNVIFALQHIYKHNGIFGLFSGIVPRTLTLMIGGGIFLGVYDFSINQLRPILS